MAAADQLLGIGKIGVLALALDIRPAGTADVGPFIPVQPAGAERVIDHFGGAFHKALLVGVLDPQDELTVILLCKKIGIERGANAAQVHKAGGAGGKTGSDCHNDSSGIY